MYTMGDDEAPEHLFYPILMALTNENKRTCLFLPSQMAILVKSW